MGDRDPALREAAEEIGGWLEWLPSRDRAGLTLQVKPGGR